MCHVAVGARDQWNVFYDQCRYSEFDQSADKVTSRWAIAPLHTAALPIIAAGRKSDDCQIYHRRQHLVSRPAGPAELLGGTSSRR
jgi:hypothetical protein